MRLSKGSASVTVAELIAELQQHDPQMLVTLSDTGDDRKLYVLEGLDVVFAKVRDEEDLTVSGWSSRPKPGYVPVIRF